MSVARSALHYESKVAVRDAPVLAAMSILSAQYPRYGYRRIQIFLGRQGHEMSADRDESATLQTTRLVSCKFIEVSVRRLDIRCCCHGGLGGLCEGSRRTTRQRDASQPHKRQRPLHAALASSTAGPWLNANHFRHQPLQT